MSAPASRLSVALTLSLAGCATPAAEVHDARSVETVRSAAAEPGISLLRFMPAEPDAVLYLDADALERSGLLDGATFDASRTRTLARVHTLALGVQAGSFVGDAEGGPIALLTAPRRPDGPASAVPDAWRASVAENGTLREGSPSALVDALVASGGENVLGGFAFVTTPTLRAALVRGAPPNAWGILENLGATIVSGGGVIAGGPSRVAVVVDVTMRDAAAARTVAQHLGLFDELFATALFHALPILERHRDALRRVHIALEGATLRATVILESPQAFGALLGELLGPAGGVGEDVGTQPVRTISDLRDEASELQARRAWTNIVTLLEPHTDSLFTEMATTRRVEQLVVMLATAYGALGRLRDERRLLERIERAHVSGTDEAWFLLLLAEVHESMGDYEAARSTIDRATVAPSDPFEQVADFVRFRRAMLARVVVLKRSERVQELDSEHRDVERPEDPAYVEAARDGEHATVDARGRPIPEPYAPSTRATSSSRRRSPVLTPCPSRRARSARPRRARSALAR